MYHGIIPAALDDFEESLHIDSDFYLATAKIGDIYQDKLEFNKANQYYKEALLSFESGPYPKEAHMREALLIAQVVT